MVRGVVVFVLLGLAACSNSRSSNVEGAQASMAAAPPKVFEDCRRAARVVDYRIACPTEFPAGWTSSFTENGRYTFVSTGTKNLRGWAWVSLANDLAANEHLVLESAPREVAPWAFVCSCRPPRGFPAYPHKWWATLTPRRHTTVRGHRAAVFVVDRADSIFQSHTVVMWAEGGHTYGVGFHGKGDAIVARDVAVAKKLALVGRS